MMFLVESRGAYRVAIDRRAAAERLGEATDRRCMLRDTLSKGPAMPTPARSFSVTFVPLLATCALAACASPRAARRAGGAPTSLSVRELNIVDEHGQARIRIGAPLPDPKGLKRAVKAVGIQFMDPSGKEIGGLAMLDSIGVRGLCFDSEEGYEAMCVGLIKGQPNVTFRYDWKERISIDVVDGVASIVLNDAQGKTRLRLEVDKDGKTRVEGLTPSPAGPASK